MILKQTFDVDIDDPTEMRRVLRKALKHYAQDEKFRDYHVQMEWPSEDTTKVSFVVSGKTYEILGTLRPRKLEMSSDVDPVLVPAVGLFIGTIRSEIEKWVQTWRGLQQRAG